MIKKLILFFILNFGALYLGSLFTNTGVGSTWYQELPKAPWTPPGWVFGVAWTLIMVCFTYYMATALQTIENKTLLWTLFILQWVLNVSWNPVFFYAKEIFWGLCIITLLTVVVTIIMVLFSKKMGLNTIAILPYFVWLLIATSLNGYIFLKT